MKVQVWKDDSRVELYLAGTAKPVALEEYLKHSNFVVAAINFYRYPAT